MDKVIETVSDEVISIDMLNRRFIELTNLIELREQHIREIIKEYDIRYQQRFEAQTEALNTAFLSAKEAVSAALAASAMAVAKAENAAEKRFESVNEFRNTLSDQAGRLMPRAEAEQFYKTIIDKIDGVNGLATRLQAVESRGLGRDEANSSATTQKNLVIGLVVGAIVSFAVMFLTNMQNSKPLQIQQPVITAPLPPPVKQ